MVNSFVFWGGTWICHLPKHSKSIAAITFYGSEFYKWSALWRGSVFSLCDCSALGFICYSEIVSGVKTLCRILESMCLLFHDILVGLIKGITQSLVLVFFSSGPVQLHSLYLLFCISCWVSFFRVMNPSERRMLLPMVFSLHPQDAAINWQKCYTSIIVFALTTSLKGRLVIFLFLFTQ